MHSYSMDNPSAILFLPSDITSTALPSDELDGDPVLPWIVVLECVALAYERSIGIPQSQRRRKVYRGWAEWHQTLSLAQY